MNKQLILFRLLEQEFALAIEDVREVVITPRIAKVPLAPDFIRGVANIRGSIFAIVDLEKKFDLSKDGILLADEHKTFILVLNQKDAQMGVLVNTIPDTVTIDETEIDLMPNLIENNTEKKHYIKGLIKRNEKLIILLDIEKLIDNKELKI